MSLVLDVGVTFLLGIVSAARCSIFHSTNLALCSHLFGARPDKINNCFQTCLCLTWEVTPVPKCTHISKIDRFGFNGVHDFRERMEIGPEVYTLIENGLTLSHKCTLFLKMN